MRKFDTLKKVVLTVSVSGLAFGFFGNPALAAQFGQCQSMKTLDDYISNRDRFDHAFETNQSVRTAFANLKNEIARRQKVISEEESRLSNDEQLLKEFEQIKNRVLSRSDRDVQSPYLQQIRDLEWKIREREESIEDLKDELSPLISERNAYPRRKSDPKAWKRLSRREKDEADEVADDIASLKHTIYKEMDALAAEQAKLDALKKGIGHKQLQLENQKMFFDFQLVVNKLPPTAFPPSEAKAIDRYRARFGKGLPTIAEANEKISNERSHLEHLILEKRMLISEFIRHRAYSNALRTDIIAFQACADDLLAQAPDQLSNEIMSYYKTSIDPNLEADQRFYALPALDKVKVLFGYRGADEKVNDRSIKKMDSNESVGSAGSYSSVSTSASSVAQ